MSGDELVAALLTMLSSQKPAADPSFGGMDPSSRKEFVASSPFFRRTQHPARPILVLLSAYPFSAPTGVAARFEVPDFLYNSLKDGDPGLPVKISVRVVNVRGVDLDIHDARVQFNGHALPSPAKLPKCRAKHDYLCCYSRGLDLTYGLVRGENEIRLTWRQVDLVSRLEDAGSSSSACFMVLFLTCSTPLQDLCAKVVAAPQTTTPIPSEEGTHEAETISLRCPISTQRIETPVKSVRCSHAACFELTSMLGSTSWHCPICNQPCRLEELALDPRMQHILASAPYTDQVVVQLNGTFKLVEKKVESEDAKHRQGISRSQPYPITTRLPRPSRHAQFVPNQELVFFMRQEDFYVRYYVGHKGRFGHEFLEFEFTGDGRLRYANNSNYKNDTMIRKEAYVGPAVLDELYRLVEETEIAKEDDQDWPVPDPSGQQELEIIMDDKHLKFTTCKLGALSEVNDCKDQEGLRVFYYLVQDLKCLVLSLISLHFRIKPV